MSLSFKTKAELRAALKAARSSLSPEARAAASRRAANHLAEDARFQCARSVALYSAVRDEADPAALEIAARRLGLRTAYPRLDPDGLVFAWAERKELVLGTWGLSEPPRDRAPVSLEALDIILVPGLGFTRAGDRIGYGKGHYDRALRPPSFRPPSTGGLLTVGFGFEVQCVDSLPTEAHDVRLDGLVTENGLTWVDRSAL